MFSDSRFLEICSKLLDIDQTLLIADSGYVFNNLPKTSRLSYDWHTEKHYYPKRRNFLNVWFPVFENKRKDNGTMVVRPKSHKETWPDFVELKTNTEGFTQYAIVDKRLDKYGSDYMELDVGDLLIFHANLVHASTTNQSVKPSFTTVSRIFDISKDLTLSSNLSVRPFGSDLTNEKFSELWS